MENNDFTNNNKNAIDLINKNRVGVAAFFLILFGLALLSVGCSLYYSWHTAANWPIAKADIESARIVEDSLNKGKFSLKGRFKYSYKGQSYDSSVFEMYPDSNTKYSNKKTKLEALLKALNKKEKLNAFVNPDFPNKAFIFRNFSGEMFLLIILGVILLMLGIFLFTVASNFLEKIETRQYLLKSRPNEPWLLNDKWENFETKSTHLTKSINLGIFSAPIFGFMALMLHDAFKFGDAPTFVLPVFAFFGLLSGAMLFHSFYMILQFLKYGESTLRLSQMPLCSNCDFIATLIMTTKCHLNQEFEFELICTETLEQGYGRNARTLTKTIYNKSYKSAVSYEDSKDNKAFVKVNLQLPENCKPGTEPPANPSITWKLLASANLSGIDFFAEFELPVYPVEDRTLIKYNSKRN